MDQIHMIREVASINRQNLNFFQAMGYLNISPLYPGYRESNPQFWPDAYTAADWATSPSKLRHASGESTTGLDFLMLPWSYSLT